MNTYIDGKNLYFININHLRYFLHILYIHITYTISITNKICRKILNIFATIISGINFCWYELHLLRGYKHLFPSRQELCDLEQLRSLRADVPRAWLNYVGLSQMSYASYKYQHCWNLRRICYHFISTFEWCVVTKKCFIAWYFSYF